jgi:thiamine pyrophosphokinase
MTAMVFVGGGDPDRARFACLPEPSLTIAADSGLDLAQRLERDVDVAVGDFDSVTPEALRAATARGTRIDRHPVAKDRTDVELALGVARELGAERVLVVGGDTGRLDHTLANALTLANHEWADIEMTGLFGRALVHVVRGHLELNGDPGELITLLAAHGPAEGVSTTGLLYPLAGDRLLPGSSRGLSNQFAARAATVAVEGGALLVVLPGELGPPLPSSD